MSLYGSPCHDILGLKGGIIVALVYYDNYPVKFFKLPKFIYETEELNDLSNDAAVLYGFILDMANLSKSKGFVDKEGRTYVYLSPSRGAKIMRTYPERIEEWLNELVLAGLIELHEREEQDNVIYPKIAIGGYKKI